MVIGARLVVAVRQVGVMRGVGQVKGAPAFSVMVSVETGVLQSDVFRPSRLSLSFSSSE